MMDNETQKHSVRIGMRSIVLSAGLSLALVLAACGGDSPPVTEPGVGVDEPAVVEPAEEGEVITEGEEIEGQEVVTEEEVIETEEVEGSETLTEETEVITDVQVMENVDVITETELVTETIVTEVITDSEVMTETEVTVDEGEAIDEQREVTVTPTPGEETVIVTDTVVVTDTVTVEEGEVDEDAITPTPAPEGETETQGAATGGISVANAPDSYVRASTLTDYDFEDVNGEDIGDIEDMLIDLNDGAILFLAVEYGGFLDLGDRDVYLPLSAFTIGEDGGLYLAMSEEELDTYPEVDNDWPNFDDPNWGAQLDEYWNSVGADAPDTAQRDASNTAWATDLVGFPMLNWGADVQSSVTDLLVNLGSGRAEYALLADDALGAEGPYVVPIEAITYDRAGEQITFEGEVDDNVITTAPRLDPATYPEGEPIGEDFDDDVNNSWRDMGFDWWNGD